MYKITIKKTTTETKIVRGEHCIVGEEQKKSKYDDETYMSNVWGYAPDREDEVTETVKVFEQSVEDLDITKVIMAINSGE